VEAERPLQQQEFCVELLFKALQIRLGRKLRCERCRGLLARALRLAAVARRPPPIS
jgi:hypothetical protein